MVQDFGIPLYVQNESTINNKIIQNLSSIKITLQGSTCFFTHPKFSTASNLVVEVSVRSPPQLRHFPDVPTFQALGQPWAQRDMDARWIRMVGWLVGWLGGWGIPSIEIHVSWKSTSANGIKKKRNEMKREHWNRFANQEWKYMDRKVWCEFGKIVIWNGREDRGSGQIVAVTSI